MSGIFSPRVTHRKIYKGLAHSYNSSGLSPVDSLIFILMFSCGESSAYRRQESTQKSTTRSVCKSLVWPYSLIFLEIAEGQLKIEHSINLDTSAPNVAVERHRFYYQSTHDLF